MRIDLEQALHDIATSVQDDVSAEHLIDLVACAVHHHQPHSETAEQRYIRNDIEK